MMMSLMRNVGIFSAALTVVWALAAPLQAAPERQPTLDELLDLPSGEDAGTQRQPVQDADADVEADAEAQRAGPMELERALERRLSGEQAADAFKQAVVEMDEVSARLGESLDTGPDTQRLQVSIVQKLEMIIEAARQQSSSSSSSSGGSGNQPQQQDTGTPGSQAAQGQQQGETGNGQQQSNGNQSSPGTSSPGQARDAQTSDRPLDEGRREWGNLPPRVRDELLQGLSERFSPLYKSMTEAYYQRLAEQGE